MRTDRGHHATPAPLAAGTLGLSDEAFVAAFEGLTLCNDRFRHYDHLRLAWIYLRGADEGAATERMVGALQRFALHQSGTLEKYHDTMTRAYMRFVAAHLRLTPGIDDFGAFAAANLELFDRRLPLSYYSEARLMSADARRRWVDPDLRALPRCHSG